MGKQLAAVVVLSTIVYVVAKKIRAAREERELWQEAINAPVPPPLPAAEKV